MKYAVIVAIVAAVTVGTGAARSSSWAHCPSASRTGMPQVVHVIVGHEGYSAYAQRRHLSCRAARALLHDSIQYHSSGRVTVDGLTCYEHGRLRSFRGLRVSCGQGQLRYTGWADNGGPITTVQP